MFFKDGVPVTSAKVGDSISFDIAGHAQIWLYQLKDGVQQFNGIFTLPMANYVMLQQDIGHYQTYAYEIVGGTYGALIESTTLNVTAADGTGGGPIGGGLDTSSILMYGGIALVAFLLLKKK